jgi:hypothetical protein
VPEPGYFEIGFRLSLWHRGPPKAGLDALCAGSDGVERSSRSSLGQTLYQKWLHCTYQLNAAFAASRFSPDNLTQSYDYASRSE